jgi:hypothetical protein
MRSGIPLFHIRVSFFETAFTACNSRVQVFNNFDGKTIALQSQTSPGKAGKRFSIRMLGFVIQVIIYISRSDQERLRKCSTRSSGRNRRAVGSFPTRGPFAAFFAVVPDQLLKCI